MNRQEVAKRAQEFMVRWLRATMPGMQAIRVDADGCVNVKDALGWRKVGHVIEWIQVARALGVV